MTQQYKSFKFNNALFLDLLNVTLSNDFYIACLRGTRSIKEEKIPGRDLPYFFEVDDEPIEFEIHFALQNKLTMTEIKTIVKNLIAFNGYKPIHFGNYESSVYTRKTPIFNVIFTGEPDFHFIGAGKNTSDVDTYLGYFKLKARADRPYGYEEVRICYEQAATVGSVTGAGPYIANITGLIDNHQFKVGDVVIATAGVGSLGSGVVTITAVSGTTISVSATTAIQAGSITNLRNTSAAGATGGTFSISMDLSLSPGFYFKKNSTDNVKIQFENTVNTNVTNLTFDQGVGLRSSEIISINPSLKTITTDNASSIYPRWAKDELLFEDGSNVFVIKKWNGSAFVTITAGDIEGYAIVMETPTFIKGD